MGRTVLPVLPVNLVFRIAHEASPTSPWDGALQWLVGLYTAVTLVIALLEVIFRQIGVWTPRWQSYFAKIRNGP